MANVDLSNQEGAAPIETPAVPLPGQPQVTSVTTYTSPGVPAQNGLLLGDKVPEFKDIIFPRINIVQGVGALKDSFPQGAIVHGQSTVLYEPPAIDKMTGHILRAGTKPVVIIVLGFRPTRYAEKIAGGARGLIVDTEAQVRANGGTLDYKEWDLKKASGMKRFEPLADALVVIEKPEHVNDRGTVFTFPIDGKNYAVALWGMKGTAYTAAAKKVFFTHRKMGCLQADGYPSYSFTLTTRLEQFPGGNSAWVPVVVPQERTGEAFLAFARSFLSAPSGETTDA